MTTATRFVTASVLLLSGLGMTWLTESVPVASASAAPASTWVRSGEILDLPFTVEADCGDCIQAGCTPGQHKYDTHGGGPDRSYAEHHPTACQPSWCKDSHPESANCGGETDEETFATLSQPQRERVRALLLGGTPSDLRTLGEEFGDVIAYNASRQTWQAKNCRGEIVFSVAAESITSR